MTEQRFLRLLELYKTDRLSPDESREWKAALDSAEHEKLLARELEKDFNTFGTHSAWTTQTKTALLDQIRSRTGMQMAPAAEEAPVLKMRSRLAVRLIAAAAVLVLIFGSYFLIIRKPTQPSESAIAQTAIKTDIAPGSNKAILTLSSGSKIILDSARNGLLTIQSGSSIIKTDSGKLAYSSSVSSTTASVSYNTLTTPRGGQHQLELSDGTKVWLNSASSITFPTAFNGNDRNVNITGEAYFEVAKDKSKPFHVKVNDMEVQVLGTHFNINSYSDEASINTTLLEGSVKITRNKQSGILKPGQQAQIFSDIADIKITNDANLEEVMAWKNGEMVLRHGNVKKLFQDISRWYDVDIEYEGAIPDGKFSGSVDRNVPLSSVLHVLTAYGIETKLEGKKIIVQ
jgi:transmembrane sensor